MNTYVLLLPSSTEIHKILKLLRQYLEKVTQKDRNTFYPRLVNFHRFINFYIFITPSCWL